jgi:hypothetical protein
MVLLLAKKMSERVGERTALSKATFIGLITYGSVAAPTYLS